MERPRSSISLVVPVYNEQERFQRTAHEFLLFARDVQGEVLFVDDGSTDRTAEIVEGFIAGCDGASIRLLRGPHRGKGAAIRTGVEAATGDLVAFCDIDLSTPLDDLRSIIDAADRGDPVLAIGSRDLPGSTMVRHQSFLRETLGRLYNRLIQLTLVPGVVDTQCGAKAASRKVWGLLLPQCAEEGFAFDVELVALARRHAVGVQEVPVRWAHDPSSRIRVLRDGVAMILSIVAISRRLREGPVDRSEIFDVCNADLLSAADADHWWFRSKAALVASALRRHASHLAYGGWLADLGAGSGGVTSMLGWNIRRCVAVDGSPLLVSRATARHGLLAACGNIQHTPMGSSRIGVVTLLDVIEHLDDPLPVLAEARRLLTDDGRLIINVPAHPWLWSGADVALGHRRRYTLRMLREELVSAGFRPVFMSHVFSWLVPPVWLTRRRARTTEGQLGLDRSSAVLDRIALALTALERVLLRVTRLPFGTSILCVAQPDRNA